MITTGTMAGNTIEITIDTLGARGDGIADTSDGRLYVPFAIGWDMAIQYLRRRLDEYPAMMFLVS